MLMILLAVLMVMSKSLKLVYILMKFDSQKKNYLETSFLNFSSNFPIFKNQVCET